MCMGGGTRTYRDRGRKKKKGPHRTPEITLI